MRKLLIGIATCLVLSLALIAGDAVYIIQGPDGPVEAKRCDKNVHRDVLGVYELAKQGCTVDFVVDVWGWPFDFTMDSRQRFGYTWVPAAHMPAIEIAPGLAMPDRPAYDPDKPPIGAILVAETIAANAEGPEVTPVARPFDFDKPDLRRENHYLPNRTDKFEVGATWVEDGVTYTKRSYRGWFTIYHSWEAGR